MIEFLFLDLDDTILDFHKAERIAIAKTFREFGIEPTEEVLARYHVINKSCWERLETGEWTRDQVLVRRFEILFAEYDVNCDGTLVARSYEANYFGSCITFGAGAKASAPGQIASEKLGTILKILHDSIV